MSDFFTEFPKISKRDWEEKLLSDLKGKSPSLLKSTDEIEELSMDTFQHAEDALHQDIKPGAAPFLRGMNKSNNDWDNGALIVVQDEREANKKTLHLLNAGANLLIFESHKESTNWTELIKGIQFEYIKAQFVVNSIQQFNEINELNLGGTVTFNIDFLESNWERGDFLTIAENFSTNQRAFCNVNGFKVQQAGATTWQEIAFCLNMGHECLLGLMHMGFNIDEAAACVHFEIGIGSNYFNEIAKIRSLKMLWSKVVGAYAPEHNCSYNCQITAVIGHLNKSLKDPYTNLLRQTTEAMSAISAGIKGIVILPYDLHSKNGVSELAERMALNISSILKEESYLDKVIDPMGGSYSLEKLTEEIGKKAWQLFQKLESKGGMFQSEAIDSFKHDVAGKRAQRIELVNEQKQVLIGINKFPNIDEVENSWKLPEAYLGMPPLVLELAHKTAEV